LVDNEDSCVAETFYHTWNKLPEERDNRNGKVYAHVKLTFEQLAVGRGGDEVYPEPLGRGVANRLDFFTDHARRFADHAEKSESARVGNRGDEFGAGDASHAGQDDGILAVKQVTDPRGQMTSQTPVSLVQGCGKGPPACGIPSHPHSCQF